MSDTPAETGASIVNPPGAGGRGGGRGSGRGGGRGDGRGGREKGARRITHPNCPKTLKIFGENTDGIQGHIFQGMVNR